MRILKDVVEDIFNLPDHGLVFQLLPSRNEMAINYYDYDFDIGDIIEYEGLTHEILDKCQSIPNIVGGRYWLVKVKQIEL